MYLLGELTVESHPVGTSLAFFTLLFRGKCILALSTQTCNKKSFKKKSPEEKGLQHSLSAQNTFSSL